MDINLIFVNNLGKIAVMIILLTGIHTLFNKSIDLIINKKLKNEDVKSKTNIRN